MSDTYLAPTDAPAQESYNFSEHQVPRILETDLVNEANANKQAQVLLDKTQYLYAAIAALKGADLPEAADTLKKLYDLLQAKRNLNDKTFNHTGNWDNDFGLLTKNTANTDASIRFETNGKTAKIALDRGGEMHFKDGHNRGVKLHEMQKVSLGDYKRSEQTANHSGWLLCNGAAVSRTTYARLFALIGASYGVGDGSATFNLPDFKGRLALAAGQGEGLTNRTKGEKGGAETHTLTTNEMPTHKHSMDDDGWHTHSVNDSAHNHTLRSQYVISTPGYGMDIDADKRADNWSNTSQGTNSSYSNISIQGAGSHSHTINSTGGGQPHENMPPFLVAGNIFIYSGV